MTGGAPRAPLPGAEFIEWIRERASAATTTTIAIMC